MTVCPAKAQISLGIRPLAKGPSFLHTDSKDADQTGRMPRLISDFAGHTVTFVGFVMSQLIWRMPNHITLRWVCSVKNSHNIQEGEEDEDHDGDETMENDEADQTGDNDSGAVVEETESTTDKTGQDASAEIADKTEQDATPEKTEADATDESAKTNVKEIGPKDTAADEQSKEKDTADDDILAEKVDDMLADKEGDDLIDLDKDGLLGDVSFNLKLNLFKTFCF